MSKSLISDEAIEKMAEKETELAAGFLSVNHSKSSEVYCQGYIEGAENMRELMLTEIVAPLVRTLRFYSYGGHIGQESEEAPCNLSDPIGFYATKELKQHAERLGETK